MEVLPLDRCGLPLRRRGKQWMCGANPIAITRDHALAGRRLHGSRADEVVHLCGAQVGVEREGKQCPPHRAAEVGHSHPQQVLHIVRHRDVLAQRVEVPTDKQPADLEGEQRVSQGGVVDPAKQMVREAEPEPFGEEVSRGAEAHGADEQVLGVSVGERLLQGRGASWAPRAEERDRLLIDASHGVRQRLLRGSVEPLDVVDREEQRISGRERAQRGQHAERDQVRLRRARRIGAVERHVERLALRRRQRRQLFGGDAIEQVDERSEGQPRLRAACPRHESSTAALEPELDAALPKAGLPDARLTLEDQRRRRAGILRYQLSDGAELSLPGDKSPRCRSAGHAMPGRGAPMAP